MQVLADLILHVPLLVDRAPSQGRAVVQANPCPAGKLLVDVEEAVAGIAHTGFEHHGRAAFALAKEMHLFAIDLHQGTGGWEQAVFNGGGDRLVGCSNRDREDDNDRDKEQDPANYF